MHWRDRLPCDLPDDVARQLHDLDSGFPGAPEFFVIDRIIFPPDLVPRLGVVCYSFRVMVRYDLTKAQAAQRITRFLNALRPLGVCIDATPDFLGVSYWYGDGPPRRIMASARDEPHTPPSS